MKQVKGLTKVENLLVKVAPILIAVAAVLIVVTILQLGKTNKAVEQTQAYTRVSNCITAKVANPPTTQVDVEKCYTQVEKATGVPLERFDMETHNEKAEK